MKLWNAIRDFKRKLETRYQNLKVYDSREKVLVVPPVKIPIDERFSSIAYGYVACNSNVAYLTPEMLERLRRICGISEEAEE